MYVHVMHAYAQYVSQIMTDSDHIIPIRFGVGVQMRAWLSIVRPMSSLLTILLVSLLQCIKVDTLGTPYKENLDRPHHYFIYFYITDRLYFYFLISF